MPEVIKDAHKQHEIKLLPEFGDAIDREIAKLDIHRIHFRRKARLVQVFLIRVDSDYTLSAALLHLDRVEARVATNVENRLSRQVVGYGVSKALPLHLRIVSEK